MNSFFKYQYPIFLIISIIFVMGFLFQKPLTGEYVFGGPDSLSPSAIKQGIEMEKDRYGEYPLWLPWVFSGLPSVHSFQNISEFYFPNFMVDVFKIMGLPTFWNYVFHFVLAGLGMFLLIKQIGLTNLCSFYGAISFVLMPYLITMVVHGHGSQMMTACWIPWVIWAIWKIYSTPSILGVGILGLVVGFQLQRAHVQIAYYTWMAAGLLICILLYNSFKNYKFKFKSFFYAFLGLFLGLCMSFSIYLPALNYAPHSIRGSSAGGGASFEYATAWSFSFGEMATFLIPSYYGFGGVTYWGNMPFTDYPNYMGVIVITLALIGSCFHKSKIKWYFLFTSFAALFLSFGKNFFMYELFYNYFPYFNKFRVPVMFLILVQFSVSILAAMGLDYIIKFLNKKSNIDKDLLKPLKQPLYILIGSIVLIIIYLRIIINFNSDFQSKVHPLLLQLRLNMINTDAMISIIFILIIISALLFTQKKWISYNNFVIILISFSIIDVCIVDRKIIEPSKGSYRKSTLINNSFKSNYLRSDEVIKFLKSDTSFYRILPLGPSLSGENRWSAFGIESILGYHPAKLYRYNLFKEKVLWIQKGILQMLNIKYIVSIEDFNHPSFEKVFSGSLFNQGKYVTASVYRFKNSIPRVFFTEEVRKVESLEYQIKDLKQNDFNPIKTTLIESDIRDIEYSSIAEANISYWSPNKIDIKVNSPTNQFLVLSEMYYPDGWEITSHPDWKIYPANMILRGFYVPRGRHLITLEFKPDDIYLGNIFASTSALLLIIFLMLGLFNQRKNK